MVSYFVLMSSDEREAGVGEGETAAAAVETARFDVTLSNAHQTATVARRNVGYTIYRNKCISGFFNADPDPWKGRPTGTLKCLSTRNIEVSFDSE
jgi:hypothetical protein